MSAVTKHLKRHFVLWLFCLFLVVIIGGYAYGYRPGPGLTFVRVGTLTLTDLPAGSKVYADQAPRGTVKTAGSFSALLVPGTHSIIVDAPDDLPWSNTVSIVTRQTTNVSPILVPKHTVLHQLSADEQKTAIASFAFAALPSESKPLRMGCADIYVSLNRVIARAASTTDCATPPSYLCTEGSCAPTIVFAPVLQLRSVIPFPGRTDSLIVSVADRVYAIAIDPRTPQFFAPIGEGMTPVLASASSTDFFLFDQGKYFSVSL